VVVVADTIAPRQTTLRAIEQRSGKSAVGYTQQSFDLFDDVAHTCYPEPAGVFGNPLKELLTVEGNYTFHFQATYGEQCTATRELIWSLHVQPGIDASHTAVTTAMAAGKTTITVIPRDKYGNNLGPGMSDAISISGAPGTTLTGPVHDNGDGSYTVRVRWDRSSSSPGVLIGQRGRAPVIVTDQSVAGKDSGRKWRVLVWLMLLIAFILFLLVLFK
jgi:hypothetical protein